MRNILRNFLITLRSYPLVVALNITGLGVAIAVAYMLAVQVSYESSYNKGIKDYDRIARIEVRGHIKHESDKWQTKNSEMVLSALRNIAGLESLAVLNINARRGQLKINEDVVRTELSFASNEAFSLFPFEIIDGSTDNLAPRNIVSSESYDKVQKTTTQVISKGSVVVISESFAKKHNLKVGSTIKRMENSADYLFYYHKYMAVDAIYKDFPDNSDLAQADIIVAMGEIGEMYKVPGHQYNFVSYVRLAPGYSVDELEEAMNKVCAAEFPDEAIQLRAMPLEKAYFYGAEVDALHKGNLMATVALIATAVVLITIAFFNYLNFFLSLMPRRIRSVNTQKIMGASRHQLRFTFIVESFIMVLVSVVIALLLIVITNDSELSMLFTASLSLLQNSTIAFIILCVSLLFAVIVAIYPSFYVTSFAPALVLSGNFARNRSGALYRTLLVIMQFVITIVLVVTAIFIHAQNKFMINADVGFNKENLLVVQPTLESIFVSNHSNLRNKLNEHPEIVDVAFSNGDMAYKIFDKKEVAILGERDDAQGVNQAEKITIPLFEVTWNFPQVMGFDIYEGRSFQEDDTPQLNIGDFGVEIIPGALIFNERARKTFLLTTENYIDSHNAPVLGFCRDFKLRPLHYQIEPFALQIAGAIFVQPYIYIRIKQGCNIKEVTEYIRTALTEYFKEDNSGVDVLLLDDIMRNEYKEDEQKALQTSLFAIVAIIVSFMGLFATVLFEVKYMEREIALRRVNGATVPSIIMLINKKYLRMVSISFVIALPIAVYVVMMWLSNFAYRTEISWWIFAVVFLVITFLSALLVTVAAWRTANRNPIEVLNKG